MVGAVRPCGQKVHLDTLPRQLVCQIGADLPDTALTQRVDEYRKPS